MAVTAEAGPSVAERLIDCIAALTPQAIPPSVRRRAEELLIDVVGLCVAARRTDYLRAIVRGVDGGGHLVQAALSGRHDWQSQSGQANGSTLLGGVLADLKSCC